jgi:hypothetical protein
MVPRAAELISFQFLINPVLKAILLQIPLKLNLNIKVGVTYTIAFLVMSKLWYATVMSYGFLLASDAIGTAVDEIQHKFRVFNRSYQAVFYSPPM